MSDREHILVVEDEQHLALGIKYNLVAEGYRVTVVGDGPAALRLLEADLRGVDLVILDLMLPGMSGYAVCETIRTLDMELPILILTARTLTEDRTRGFEAGANQYLTKPFDLDEFLARVRNLLTFHGRDKRGGMTASTVREFAFGNARINFETFEVTVDEEAVRLTQLEMTLLRYFVEHEGRVIPRRELLEQVWGLPGGINTRAPDQFIRRLRKTFEADPAQPRHFLTIRDAGYRFVAQPE
jgi:two-component system OmpR family response regulator